MHRWQLREDAELRVYSRRRLDHPQRFQVSLLDTSLREQSQALAQQHGHDADVDFVTQSRAFDSTHCRSVCSIM